MKKIFTVFLTLLLLAVLAVSISADDAAKTKLYNAASSACPETYRSYYMGIAQNVLDQIDVTNDQADQVITLINDGKLLFTDKGPSLEAYSSEE